MLISHTHNEPTTEELGITRTPITTPLVIIGFITVLIVIAFWI